MTFDLMFQVAVTPAGLPNDLERFRPVEQAEVIHFILEQQKI